MRILVLTNLYPNPFHRTRATFNRQQFRALAERHEVRVISPISWVDELAARRKGAPALPRDRRVEVDGITVEHPRYLYPPKVLRGWYGHFFRRSARPAFDRAYVEFRPDVVHVLARGRIIKTGGRELALELERSGYAPILREAGLEVTADDGAPADEGPAVP